jgi:hypothetical protein
VVEKEQGTEVKRKTKQTKEQKNQPRHKKDRKKMRLEKKTATEADEARQSINCGEQFHESGVNISYVTIGPKNVVY